MTGSATPNHKGILHSGAGRIAKLRMRPMSLFESGNSSGDISLKDICEGRIEPKILGEVDLRKLIDFIIRGGWPANQETTLKQAAYLPIQYIQAVLDDDVYRIDNVKRDKHKMELLLRSLARNEATTVTNKKLKMTLKKLIMKILMWKQLLLILMFSKDFSSQTIRNLLRLNLDHQSALSRRKRDICQTHH